MKQAKFIILLLGLIFLNAAAVLAGPPISADEKTVVYLNKFRAAYTECMVANKPERLQVYFAENIRLMPEFQKTIMGKSNALSYHKAFSARFAIQDYSRAEIEVLDLGACILETGVFSMKIKLRSTGLEQELLGKYQDIWQKQENGKLALITEAWNYNHHLEFAEELMFSEVPVINIAFEAHVTVNSNISFELAALNRLQEITITQHDQQIWSQFYTDDAMFIYSNNPIYEGRQAIDEFLEQHVRELPVFEKLDIRNDQIDELGNYVIEYASHIAIIRNGEYSGIHTGKDMRIWRREPNGSLKIFRQMAMYD